MRISSGLDATTLEVVDDGIGMDRVAVNGSDRHGGHGLDGLAERAGDLLGRVEAGPRANGGFRLAVSVPRQQ
jgi:signal transduction histidine kinase